jgi:CDP-paratose 2-epimerase|tara:strand:- start:3055 stop:4107 length:1053 start_codon:yes stop_codon:yes gene_type:complete
MNIALITGSCGLVGSESVNFFIKKKFKVLGIDNNLREFFFGKDGSTLWLKKSLKNQHKKNYQHLNIDIRDYKKLDLLFKKCRKKIKVVIHCAAQPSHDWAASNPTVDFGVNANGTLNLLQLANKYLHKKTPFIYMSTNKVYGDTPNYLKIKEHKSRYDLKTHDKLYWGINESMSIDNCVHSLFGASKLSADILVQEYGKNFGLNTVCFRAGCITGSNHSGAKLHGFLSYLVKSCIQKKSYTIFGYKGKQVRDNIHSKDLISCFWEFYKKPTSGNVYNIGGERKCSCSIIEAIKIIEKELQIKIKINYQKQHRTGDHKWWITNNQKFKKDYPKFKITYNIKKIIKELIENK